MKYLSRTILIICSLAGCVIHLDNPPLRFVSGRVVRADTGAPVAKASVSFHSGRKVYSPLPVDTFGIDALTKTDAQGRFSVSAKLNADVQVIVQNDEFFQVFTLPPFPPSSRVENLVYRLSGKKHPVPRRP